MYVFDSDILCEVACSHPDLPLEIMLSAITQDFTKRYPGLIETERFFSNAVAAYIQAARRQKEVHNEFRPAGATRRVAACVIVPWHGEGRRNAAPAWNGQSPGLMVRGAGHS